MPPDRGPSEQAVVFTLGFEDEATKQLETAVDSFEMAENDIGKAVTQVGRDLGEFEVGLQDVGKTISTSADGFRASSVNITADYNRLAAMDDIAIEASMEAEGFDDVTAPVVGDDTQKVPVEPEMVSDSDFAAMVEGIAGGKMGVEVELDDRKLMDLKALSLIDPEAGQEMSDMLMEFDEFIRSTWKGSEEELQKVLEDGSIFQVEAYKENFEKFWDKYAQRHPEVSKFLDKVTEEWGEKFEDTSREGLEDAIKDVEATKPFSSIGASVSGAMSGAGDAVKSSFAGAATKILGVIGLMSIVMKVMEPVVAMLEDAIMPLIVPIQDALVQIVDALRPLFNALNPIINQLLGKLLPPIIKIIESLIPVVTSLLDALMPIIDILMFGLMPIIAQLAPMILDLLIPVLDLLLYPLKMIASLFGDVEDSVDSAGESAMNFGSIVFDWMLMPLKVFWDFVSFIFSPDKWVALINDPIGFAIDTLMGWMPSWLKWLLGIDDESPNEASGEDLINTFGEGIESAEPTLEQIVDSTLEQGVGEQLPSSDADRGPLSDLSGAGASTIETFGKGMEEEQGFLDSIFSSMFSPFSLLFGLPGMALGAITEMVKTPKLKPEVPQVDMSSKGESFTDGLKPVIEAIEEGAAMIVNAIKEQDRKKPPADAGIGVNPGYRNLAEFRL